MTARRRLAPALAAALLAPLLVSFGGDSDAPPNVLVVLCDQLGGSFLGCAGDEQARTPHLDRLAGEGVRFSRAVAPSPRCSPCRASVQTGTYPHVHGVRRNGDRLSPDVPTFAELFARAGYATGYAGKWGLDGDRAGGRKPDVGGWVPPGRRRGWSEWHGYERGHRYEDVWTFDESVEPPRAVPVPDHDWEPAWHTGLALDFARRHTAAGRPWLYFVSYGPPHHPPECPERFLERIDADALALPAGAARTPAEERELRQLTRVYYAQVAAVDHEVGRLVAGLTELGVARDTIVLFTSDHGDTLGAHREAAGGWRGKGLPFLRAFHVPLLVRWPDAVRPAVHDTLVASVDVAPTLLELAGLPVPSHVQGRSLAGWCTRGEGAARDGVYLALEGGRGGRWRAVWDGRYLLSTLGVRHFFDHADDPDERRDRLGDPALVREESRMGRLLVRLGAELGDPELARVRRALIADR